MREKYIKQGGMCALCGGAMRVEDASKDHIIPRSKGGGGGIQITHKICNSLKGDSMDDRSKTWYFDRRLEIEDRIRNKGKRGKKKGRGASFLSSLLNPSSVYHDDSGNSYGDH